jgi:pimeloyl-ACP methyl ester carboxylesterase
MEAIRVALGDDKLTYLGYSYGTLLGAVYAQLFPGKVRAMVLDGAIDPTKGGVDDLADQAKGFERAFDNFATWCRTTPGSCPIAPDARAAVVAAMQAARQSPVRGPDGRAASAGWILTAVGSAMYSQQLWPGLANAISDLGKGSATRLFQLADSYTERDRSGHYNNLFDAFFTVMCTDSPDTVSRPKIRELQSQWRTQYPLFGPRDTVELLACSEWPGKRDPYPAGAAGGAPPIVVVGTTGDPATPYEQTARLAGMLGVGVVLTWQGEGHTAYPQTRCVNEAVNRYLISLTAPPRDTICPPR